MNPYPATRTLMDTAQAELGRWAAARIVEAGYPGVTVGSGVPGQPPQGPQAREELLPYRLVPWPRRIESTPDLPLLRINDKQAGVPEPWRQLGLHLTRSLDALTGSDDPSGRRRGPGMPLLRELPKPMARWYRDTGGDWVVGEGDEARGRLPALLWRPAFIMRAYFLILAQAPVDRPQDSLSMLSVLGLAINRDRTLDLELPAPAEQKELTGLVKALSASVEPELGRPLRGAIKDCASKSRWRLTIVPFPDLDDEDLGSLMRALGRPLQPSIHLALQVPLGAQPVLLPAAGTPTIHTANRGR